MGSLARISLFGILQIIVAALIGIFIESVASGKLLFTEGILTEELRSEVINHPWWVISILVGINFILFLIMEKKRENTLHEKIYNNVCHKIFSDFIAKNETLENNDFKIIFFKIQRGVYILKERGYIPAYGPYLKSYGFFETKQNEKKINRKYLPKHGWAGICYRTASIVTKEIKKYDENNPDSYFNDCEKHFQLPKWKAKQLEDKPCSFLCYPMKFHDSHKVFGVISVECTQRNKIKKLDARKLEEIVSYYSVFFHLTP